jgi:hypothetical protein
LNPTWLSAESLCGNQMMSVLGSRWPPI